MAKKIRVWDGSAWQDVAPALPYTAVHSAQASMPLTAVDGQIWLDTDASVPSTSVTRWYKLPAAGTTTLSGNDDNSIPLAYTPGYEQVFLNGTLLSRSAADYTATTGTSVVLSSAIVAGDIVEIICPLQITTTDTYTQSAANNKFVQNTGYYSPGKNKFINGDFYINQRNFSTVTTTGNFGFDRWALEFGGGTATYSAQTFAPGTAPVAGYEGKNYARLTTASQSGADHYACLYQRIEDVRTLSNQTVTVSFWAKAASGTPNVGVGFYQEFNPGAYNLTTAIANPLYTSITTSWARYSFTLTIPSVAGKTIGASSFLHAYIFTSCGSNIAAAGYPSMGAQSTTIDIWGAQIEAGSNLTGFQTATGAIQGELAACQRYYYRNTAGTAYAVLGTGYVSSTTQANFIFQLPVTMRTAPTSAETSNVEYIDFTNGVVALSSPALSTTEITPQIGRIGFTISGGTAGRGAFIRASNNSAAYVGFSAEL